MAFFAIIFVVSFIGAVLYILDRVGKVDSKEAKQNAMREMQHLENLNYLRENLNSMDEDSYHMVVETLVKLHKKVEELERTYKKDH
jgi:hypothetical protein